MDRQTNAKIIASMFAMYGQGNDGVRIAGYTTVLSDIPTDILSKVCKKLILESRFLPSVAEIVESSRSLVGSIDESSRLKTWDEAWQEIQTQLHDAFVYEKPKFSRPEIELAVKRYGWTDLCSTPAKEWHIAHAQLRDIYLSICKRSKEESVNKFVLGEGNLLGNTSIKRIN